MALDYVEVRRKFVNEVSRQALRRIDANEEVGIPHAGSILRLPIKDEVALEPIYEWHMGVAGTSTTTTTAAP